MRRCRCFIPILLFECFNIVQFTRCQTEDGDVAPPINIDCTNAIPISVDAADATFSTTNRVATDVFNLTFEQCDEDTFNVGTPGVWFSVAEAGAAGARWRASTCSERTITSSHRLTIYGGTDCGSTTCIQSSAENDPECPYSHSNFVEWVTSPGEQYSILVHDDGGTGDGSGDFGLRLTDLTEPPINSACENATILTLKDDPNDELPLTISATGSTLGSGAEAISAPFECRKNDESDNTATVESSAENRVWYRITPSPVSDDIDETLALFLCSSPVGLRIAVFAASPCTDNIESEVRCQETKPVTLNRTTFSCGKWNDTAMSTSWNVTAGQEYFVRIYGVDAAEFGLTVLRLDSNYSMNDLDSTSGCDTGQQTIRTLSSRWMRLVVFFVTIYLL